MLVKCSVARILYYPYKFPSGKFLSLLKRENRQEFRDFLRGWYAPRFGRFSTLPSSLPLAPVDRRGRAYLSFCQASGEKRRRSCGMLMYNGMVLSCTLNCRPAEFFPLEEQIRGGEGKRGWRSEREDGRWKRGKEESSPPSDSSKRCTVKFRGSKFR